MENTQVISNSLDFNSIYKQYYKEIVNFVGFKMKDSIIAEEIVNDSFMKLYNNLSTFDAKKAGIKTWLFTIVNNTVIDYQRAYKKEHNKSYIDNTIEGKRVYEINDSSNNIFDVMCNNDIKNNVLNSISKLSNDSMKKVAQLYFIEDLSYNEISETLEISLSNVKVLIHRIRIELQSNLRRNEVYV
jgi:RNA polymerase sigma-70 factor (ECF subfamily)